MALDYQDAVGDTTSTTGTSDFVVDSNALTGCVTFASALTDGNTYNYRAQNSANNDWEVGRGVWTASTRTLTRVTIFRSSNSGSKTPFGGGPKGILIVAVATDVAPMALMIQRTNRNMFTEAKQSQLETGGVEGGYTNGVANAGTDLVTTTTYQKVIAVPFPGEAVLVRPWYLNSSTSAVTFPAQSVSFNSGVTYSQDHPTTDGTTVSPWTLDNAGFTVPAAGTDANAQYTGKTYTRTSSTVSVTITGHGVRENLSCYISSATDTALNGFRPVHVVDANTLSFDNPNGSLVGGTLSLLAQSGVQGIGYGNWVRVNILAATDGGTFGYLYGRQFGVAINGMTFRTDLMAADTNVPRLVERIKVKTLSNWLTQTTGSFNASTGNISPFNVQILSAKNAVTIAFMGDSTSAGAGSTSGYMGWPQIATDSLSTVARPVVCNSIAWNGQSPPFFFGRASTLLDYADMRPDILVIQPGGQNKGGLGWASINATWAWGETLKLIAKCQQYGVIPVLRTCTPSADLSAADDLVRKAYNTYVRAAASQGIAVIDFVALVTVAGTPESLIPAYAASNAHLNDAGHQLVAPYAAAVLRNLIRR